jgi:5-methylcytosine-specific restriction protein A
VTDTALTTADRLLAQALDALDAVAETGGDAELVGLLGRCEKAARRLDRATVTAVAALDRRGVFTERGYRSSAAALADLLGLERGEARRRTLVAEQVAPRSGSTGRRCRPTCRPPPRSSRPGGPACGTSRPSRGCSGRRRRSG